MRRVAENTDLVGSFGSKGLGLDCVVRQIAQVVFIVKSCRTIQAKSERYSRTHIDKDYLKKKRSTKRHKLPHKACGEASLVINRVLTILRCKKYTMGMEYGTLLVHTSTPLRETETPEPYGCKNRQRTSALAGQQTNLPAG